MATLRKADVLPVHSHKRAGGDALQHEVHAAPDAVQRERALIHAAGVLVRRVGRVAGEGKVEVGVIGMLVAVQLPAGGNGDFIPVRDDFRHVDVPGEEREAPRSVQKLYLRLALRQVIGPLGQAVFTGSRRVLIDALHEQSSFTRDMARCGALPRRRCRQSAPSAYILLFYTKCKTPLSPPLFSQGSRRFLLLFRGESAIIQGKRNPRFFGDTRVPCIRHTGIQIQAAGLPQAPSPAAAPAG